MPLHRLFINDSYNKEMLVRSDPSCSGNYDRNIVEQTSDTADSEEIIEEMNEYGKAKDDY